MALCPVGFESKQQEEGTNSSFQTMPGDHLKGNRGLKQKMLCKRKPEALVETC